MQSKNQPRQNHRVQSEAEKVCQRRRAERLFKRCDHPSLPAQNTLYATAKRLEYDGDISGALEMLYAAMQSGERVDSCMKDIAGILNMMGRVKEAIEFLKAHEDKVTNKVGYMNLLTRLENDAVRDASDLPRSVRIQVLDERLGSVTLQLCDRLFPNPAKIRRILYNDEFGYIATVHFASHSSARKALQVQKMCPETVVCEWADEVTESRLRNLESLEEMQEVSTRREWIPAHLRGAGSATIPLYREPLTEEQPVSSSPSLSCEISPISTMTTPVSEHNKSPPSVLQDILNSHQGLFTVSDGVPPYLSSVQSDEGHMIPALVIPFRDDPANTNVSKIFNYARALNTVASALLTVASILETRRRHNLSPCGSIHEVFETPVRKRNQTEPALTPSPIIMRNMFT